MFKISKIFGMNFSRSKTTPSLVVPEKSATALDLLRKSIERLRSGTKENLQNKVQSTLGFETLDIAAALDLETATPLTDLCQ